MMWIDGIEFYECRFSSGGDHRRVLSGSVDSAPTFHLGPRHHTGPASHLCTLFSNINTIYFPNSFNTFSLCSQLQMLESVHRPIALKSSLSGGILESICVMDCAPFVRAVLSPLSGSAFLQVSPSVLSYCLPDCIVECWSRHPSSFVGNQMQTLLKLAKYCS